MNVEERQKLLDEFLSRWNINTVKNMTLSDYVGVGNEDTFCQWVETKTRILGSIKGMTSIKFGIYERQGSKEPLEKYQNDEKYTWMKRYGDNREQAFAGVKKDLIKTIKFSERGDFSSIDSIVLPSLFKWKVAFLYSNERLIPIYKREVLYKIAESFGLRTTRDISAIQQVMMQNKLAHLSVYEYMRYLFDRFGREEDHESIDGALESVMEPRRGRKPSENRNTNSQVRTIARSYVVEQKHNKLQEALKKELIEKFGKENVLLEQNFVDVKVLQPEYITFYEVKSSPYASDCIREAMGQLLAYAFYDTDKRPKRLVVVGQYPPNDSDKLFIQYLKTHLTIEFEYMNINLQ